jgi:hypothetical protein
MMAENAIPLDRQHLAKHRETKSNAERNMAEEIGRKSEVKLENQNQELK